MKNLWTIIYCALFFAIILTPLALAPVVEVQLAENRPPAPAPELIKDGSINLSAPLEAEEFFKDRYAGRTSMITAYSRLVGSVFGISANEKVIVGRDGWLFFAETVGDFDGSAALDDAQMTLLIENLLEMKRAAEARGQAFIIAVAPNKNTLYGEHMPLGYKRTSEPTNLEQLLAVEELECIDLGAALLAAEEIAGMPLYLKTDSHWNGIGARVVACELMLAIEEKTGSAAGFDWHADFSWRAYFDWSSSPLEDAFFESVQITGDLAQMLYPSNPPNEWDIAFHDARQSYTTVGRFRTLDDLNITTESDGAPLRVAMYRDSFAISLIPYISNAYSNVYYTRQTPPPMGSDAFTEADVIIFQIVERRLGELLE